ncbi:MAG: endonuclease domain-containing protein, partial [Rickettsiales bacterium]
GYGFRRQYPIDKKYIADFVCLEKKLVIELDGGQHAEQIEYDNTRTKFLNQKGYEVLRFWNNDIMENIEGVLTLISEHLKKSPSLTLPPSGRGDFLVPSPACGGGLGRGLQETLAGMQLTGYFLEHSLLAPHGKKLPAARMRLQNILQELNATEIV